MKNNISISVFGLGYVGAVCSACFSNKGYKVIGVDINVEKVKNINDGISPIIESKLDEIIKNNVETGNLVATSDIKYAINNTDISIISVGTPSRLDGSLDLDYVKKVSIEIGKALKNKKAYHLIILRSTVLPGTTKDVVIPAIGNASGKKNNVDFGVAFNPEFLREGSAVNDFYNPPKTVVGTSNNKDSSTLKKLYSDINAPFFIVDTGTAETIKYADNAFHALKVAFANEIGTISKKCNIDSHKVMEIFCSDTKLNLSPYYLKPGFAFGGSCLPKDLRALNAFSKINNLTMPLLDSIIPSNKMHIQRTLDYILSLKKKNIGILGFSFKKGTDDLRESPIINIVESLISDDYNLQLYDENVSMSHLIGLNRIYIEKKLPYILDLISSDIDEIVTKSDIIIVGHKEKKFSDALAKLNNKQHVIDLVRLDDINTKASYEGICW
tara:strand:- start:139 stop:1461 length:1323 start_codon:yes stop_codon:yes gene_type:complete